VNLNSGFTYALGPTRSTSGRTEDAGQHNSAALAYSRFLRFWEKADPELQGRAKEAKQALQRLTRERPGSP
jgi:hypothetical protein